MKSNIISLIGVNLILFLLNHASAQSFGVKSSAVWISDCTQSNFFNTSGNTADLIGPPGNSFDNTNLGIYTQNSGTLILRGAQVRTFKNPASSNVCNVQMYYRVYLQGGSPGAFNAIDLPFLENCNVPSTTFPSGGSCQDGDQKWQRVIPDGTTTPYAPVNLTAYPAGNYVLEVYYALSGSNTAITGCADMVTLNNSGSNYKAFFSIQSPSFSSVNPSSCSGNEGSITISGLAPGASYQLSYTDDGVNVGPLTFVANASGQIIIAGLNKGFYFNFSLSINGCTSNLSTGIILSDPVYVPVFTTVPPFCAGTAAPVLPAISSNGISGTWNPATVNNQASGTYTFTPGANQCGVPVTLTINVIPNITPTFSFGTSLIICGDASVPTLPTTSLNGITGTWSPATVSNQTSGTYTFTPNTGQCATPATFTVTVNPNITPSFSFGTSSTICEDDAVPALPATSLNGITGTWNPATVSNQTSGTYTFTPNTGQCATPATFTVTVNPKVTPVFSLGNLTICAGDAVPALPATSNNGISGTWSPSAVSNQTTGTYTFTPGAGQCALPFSFTVTVNPKTIPAFSFGTALTICAGASVPALPANSLNGINGTWSPSTADNQTSGTYIFTPATGQCAATTTFTVTVNPNITPTFSFGSTITICEDDAAPVLPLTSANAIAGTWSPATVSNQASGIYIFTPNPGQCGTTTPVIVNVNPRVIPGFSLSNFTICAGDPVPALPATSINGISGTWNPSAVNNQTTGTYTFTPSAASPCSPAFTFTVTVRPVVTPAFSFGTFQSVCINTAAPVLPALSTNGISGTWSPSTVDNQTSGIYTFTPAAGQCANSATFEYEVNPVPVITIIISDTTVYDGDALPGFNFTSTPGSVINWTNDNPSVGLAASGTGSLPSFTAVNTGTAPVIAIITATAAINGCTGTAIVYKITVLPLHKDVFVPNVFSPNGDGKNDILYVYGNYIDKVDMRIFNQWGQQIAVINKQAQGWDGRHNGSPQPVGVYVYVLKAVLVNGTSINLKGSITLVR